MNLIQGLIEKLQRHPKRFVFTDGDDARVLQAARQVVTRGMGVPMLIGDRSIVKAKAAKLGLDTKGMRIIEPERSSELDAFIAELAAIPRFRDLTPDALRKLALDPCYFAAVMLRLNQAEAILTGANVGAVSSLRPLLQVIGTQEGIKTASSLLILDLEEKGVGIDGALFMGDCGVIPEPTPEQLADIAIATANLARHITNAIPKVAMLSYATHGSAQHAPLLKVREATRLATEKAAAANLMIEIEGEMQIDAALDKATAIMKGVGNSPVAGSANILIFPDLNSGNIASKLVQLLTGANKFGHILTGLRRPAAEISRGASAHDILGAAAITGCQAIDSKLLYGN